MDRSDYVALRSSVECILLDALGRSCGVDPVLVTNQVMRSFCSALASQEIKRKSSKKVLLTFRRTPVVVPTWAYRKPGTASRSPKLDR